MNLPGYDAFKLFPSVGLNGKRETIRVRHLRLELNLPEKWQSFCLYMK